jgi:antitoxin (DNA-binding transcriptional repressor) of toxin-antitoxin stability system
MIIDLAIPLAKEHIMSQFSVHKAKTNLSKLIASALNGEDVIIAHGSVPVVRLVPVVTLSKRQFGSLKGIISSDERFNDPLPENELSDWHLT